MSDIVFPPEFFKKLKKFFKDMQEFFKNNWFWGVILVIGVAILVVFQQILLFLFSGAL